MDVAESRAGGRDDLALVVGDRVTEETEAVHAHSRIKYWIMYRV